MRTVPNFALYGTEAHPAWAEWVHFEEIPDRSSLFDWEIDPHVHDALIQVLYPVQGGGEAVIDDVKWVLRPPCLIVAPAGAVHSFRFRPDIDGPVVTAAQRPLESIAAVTAPELLPHIRRPTVLPVDPAGRHAAALLPLFEAIGRESRTHAPGQVAAGPALLLALFVQIARLGDAAPIGAEASRSRKAAQLERFRALVDAHFREHRPVERYAHELGISAGQLGRLCREQLGQSTLDLIHARLLHEAQRELVYSSLGIKQIAAELGFDDDAYFGRFFRKQTGQTPTAFRQAARRQLAAG